MISRSKVYLSIFFFRFFMLDNYLPKIRNNSTANEMAKQIHNATSQSDIFLSVSSVQSRCPS